MNRKRRAIVPLTLGLGMLGVVVAAGLSPNAGVVRAASNCTYGNCVSSTPFPLWAVASSIAAVVVALLLALLLLRRRRRPGQPPSEWQGPGDAGGPGGPSGGGGAPPYAGAAGAGAAVGATAAVPAVEPASSPAWHEGTSEQAEEPADAMVAPTGPPPPPEYLETPSTPEPAPEPTVAPIPEPAPMAPPVPPRVAPPAPAAAPPPTTAAGEEAEPDIDSLMAELEKISGEILKQKPKKKNGASPPADDDA